MSNEPRCLSACQFKRCRVFLLGHQARPRCVRVVQCYKVKFRSRIQNQIFAQMREMHVEQCSVKQKLSDEIAVAYGINAVFAYAFKSQLARKKLAVDSECISSQRARAQRQNCYLLSAVIKPHVISMKHPEKRHQPVRKENGLGAL